MQPTQATAITNRGCLVLYKPWAPYERNVDGHLLSAHSQPALRTGLMAPAWRLELIQSHMAQKPMLRGEVGTRAWRVRSVSIEEAWASAGVQGAWASGRGREADQGVLGSQRPSI